MILCLVGSRVADYAAGNDSWFSIDIQFAVNLVPGQTGEEKRYSRGSDLMVGIGSVIPSDCRGP